MRSAAACLLAVLALGPSSAPGQTVASLKWVGCETSYSAYVADLARAFEANTGVVVALETLDATAGIRSVAAMSADIGGSSRFAVEGEEREAAATLSPVAWGALVAIVHPDNPVTDISFSRLRDLYRGRIRNWKELGGEDQPLALFGRSDELSGVGFSLRQLLYGNVSREIALTRSFESSRALEEAVQATPGAIALTGVSNALKRRVKILSLEGVAPSYDNIKSGAYPLYRPLYLVTNTASEKRPVVEQFVEFAYSPEGMAIMRRNGVVPYNDALHLVMKKLEQEQRALSSDGN